MEKNKKILLIILGILFILTIIFVSLQNDKGIYVTYKDFVRDVELDIIDTVDIQTDYLFIKYNENDGLYYTDNPETNDFKEYLLLNDISVIDEGDKFIQILDVLFYVIFFGAAIFGIYKLCSYTRQNFKIIRNNTTKFSDVVGLDDIKNDMKKTVDVLKNVEKYKNKGIRAPKGIILEGPPGNGKTLFARALAGEANMNFIATKGADFQSAMMSVGPRKIKTLFKKARRNKPCIIFIDEFDGIGERRSYAGTGIDKENNRIITAMLNEMDGFSNEEGVLVIAATNSYESLDAALIRPGRFDKKYKIQNPKNENILKLIEMYTSKKKLEESIKKEALAKCFEGLSCAAIETILNEASMDAEMNEKDTISLEDIVNAGKKTGTVNIKIK